MKWVGLVLVIAGIATGAWFLREDFGPTPQEIDVFHRIWNEDLESLENAKKLPTGWDQIRMVEYIPLDKEAWNWIENRKPNIEINPDGGFKLEILIDLIDDEDGRAALVEYHLIDLSTEDKIWEAGRTFPITEKKKN